MESDEWSTNIRKYLELPSHEKQDVSIMEVLTDNQFMQLAPRDVGRAEQIRAGAILKRLGWARYRKRTGSDLEWRYRRA